MLCQTRYVELMSLKLDGLLSSEDAHDLEQHVTECGVCATVWGAMRSADTLLSRSAEAPLRPPAEFTRAVMLRVTASDAYRPASSSEVVPAYPVPLGSVLPLPGQRAGTLFPPVLDDWRLRAAPYLRGALAALFALAMFAGLVVAVALSGAFNAGGPAEAALDVLRAISVGVVTWASAIVESVGIEVVGVAGIVLALLAMTGWQLTHSYYRSSAQLGQDRWLPAEA